MRSSTRVTAADLTAAAVVFSTADLTGTTGPTSPGGGPTTLPGTCASRPRPTTATSVGHCRLPAVERDLVRRVRHNRWRLHRASRPPRGRPCAGRLRPRRVRRRRRVAPQRQPPAGRRPVGPSSSPPRRQAGLRLVAWSALRSRSGRQTRAYAAHGSGGSRSVDPTCRVARLGTRCAAHRRTHACLDAG